METGKRVAFALKPWIHKISAWNAAIVRTNSINFVYCHGWMESGGVHCVENPLYNQQFLSFKINK
jgi:hypothetical protein